MRVGAYLDRWSRAGRTRGEDDCDLIRDRTGRDFSQDPRAQMDMAVRAVFDSWNTERAALYRRQERIPEDLGTAVNIRAMVFGNGSMDSGTGSRSLVTCVRRAGLTVSAAESAGRGCNRRHPQHRPLGRSQEDRQGVARRAARHLATLEEHYKDDRKAHTRRSIGGR